MNFERISIKAAILWEILALAIFALLFIVAIILLNPGTWLWYLVLWVLGAACVIVTFLYIPLAYNNIQYAITDKTVIYKKGVIFPSTQIMYRDRIAFVSVYKNPLTPILHISSLVVSAAGGNIRILFLTTTRAEQLSEILTEK